MNQYDTVQGDTRAVFTTQPYGGLGGRPSTPIVESSLLGQLQNLEAGLCELERVVSGTRQALVGETPASVRNGANPPAPQTLVNLVTKLNQQLAEVLSEAQTVARGLGAS